MDQVTLWGIDDELYACIRGLAERENISLNQAVLRLLRRGAGLPDTTLRSGTVDWALA